jgi:hypothetical protein
MRPREHAAFFFAATLYSVFAMVDAGACAVA